MRLPWPFRDRRTSVMSADALLFSFKFLIWKPSGNVIRINHTNSQNNKSLLRFCLCEVVSASTLVLKGIAPYHAPDGAFSKERHAEPVLVC